MALCWHRYGFQDFVNAWNDVNRDIGEQRRTRGRSFEELFTDELFHLICLRENLHDDDNISYSYTPNAIWNAVENGGHMGEVDLVVFRRRKGSSMAGSAEGSEENSIEMTWTGDDADDVNAEAQSKKSISKPVEADQDSLTNGDATKKVEEKLGSESISESEGKGKGKAIVVEEPSNSKESKGTEEKTTSVKATKVKNKEKKLSTLPMKDEDGNFLEIVVLAEMKTNCFEIAMGQQQHVRHMERDEVYLEMRDEKSGACLGLRLHVVSTCNESSPRSSL